MAFLLKDRVKETSTTTGTGAFTLGGASATFDTFSSVLSDGDTTYYAIVHAATGTDEWEVGLGTFASSGSTLTRTTVLSSSNNGSATNFSAGDKDVFITYPADKAIFKDGSGNVTISGNLTVDGTTTTVNSTTVTVDDPIFTIGGDSAPSSDDNKDRGIEFRYHNGSAAKVGFFGFDDSTGKFTFIPDATNNSEVFSGTAGTVVAALEGNVTGDVTGDVTGNLTGNVTGNVTGDVTGDVTGNLTGNVTGNVSGSAGSATGNAATATALATARNIGGVSFDGSADITLPGVNSAGNQDTTGNAATATALETARQIAGVNFDGTANIAIAPTDLTGVTSTAAEINILDGATLDTAELNILDGVTATTAELNILDGVTATATELNYVDGVTSAIQTQLDAKPPLNTIAVTVAGGKFVIDGTSQHSVSLVPNVTYRFDQSDSTNATHPIKFSTTSDGTHNSGSAFTTGITSTGTPGSAGAYSDVKLENDAPQVLFYYCQNHSGMGAEINVGNSAIEDHTSLTAAGSTLTIDLAASKHFIVTMTANTTFAFSNIDAGRSGNIVIKEDSTGGYSFTLPSEAKTPLNGATITQQTGANKVSVLSYHVLDSSNVLVNYIGDFA